MNEYNILILIGIIGFGIGFAIAFWVRGKIVSQKAKDAQDEAIQTIEDAKRKSSAILREAQLEVKDRLLKMKSEFDADTKETRIALSKKEKRLIQKEENIDRKIDQLEQRDHEISQKGKNVIKIEEELKQNELKYKELIKEQKKQLEKISGLTTGQAKELLIRAMENDARYEGAKLIKRIENETKDAADKKAKKIIATAIQR